MSSSARPGGRGAPRHAPAAFAAPPCRRYGAILASEGPAAAWVGQAVGQVGIVVADLEAAASRYSAIWRNGPWRCYTYGPELLSEQIYRGRVTPFSVRIALNSQQPQIELLQPLLGPSVYHEWAARRGDGVHHLAIYVERLDEAVNSMHDAGIELLQLGRGFGLDGDGGFAYFDTEEQLGVVLEAIELPARRREPELVIP
jgi:methylmalonyl-CoA/ethylmalonyl-CoA epimerase